MAEDGIKQKIVIEDGFSGTLEDLSEQSEKTSESVDGLTESLDDQTKGYQEASKATERFSNFLGKMNGMFAKVAEGVRGYTEKLSGMYTQLTDTSQAQSNMMKMFFVGNTDDGIINKYFDHMNDVISRNIESIELRDKLRAMYGDAADEARDSSFKLAMQIGEDTKEVTKLAAKSAQQGIGTQEFERIMMLADRVGSLNYGEDTMGVAEQLVSNMKSGHDAGTIASLYGGGEKMERQLKAAGYERALNAGDLNKALDIAEKIAQEAGYTNEAYENASQSLSRNWKRIGTFVENIRDRVETLYTETFEPLVKCLADFLQSKEVQTAVKVIDGIANIITNYIKKGVQFIADNIDKIFKIGMVATAWSLLTPIRLISIAMGGTTLSFLAIIAAGVGLFMLLNHILQELGVCESTAGLIAGTFVFWKNVLENVGIFIGNIPDLFMEMLYKTKSKLLSFAKSILEIISGGIKSIINDWLAGIDLILSALGVDIDLNDAIEAVNGVGNDFLQSLDDKILDADRRAKIAADAQDKYIDALKGVDEAYQIQSFEELGDKIGDYFGQFTTLNKTVKGIAGNTDAIRKYNEQEEDLSWLKAFSDRQITSSYSSMTSNVRNVTFNGMSQAGMAEMGRRNISTIPSRARM